MIHQYKNNGYNIVLDVNSGCVHAVDELVYDVLPFFEEENKDNKVSQAYKRARNDYVFQLAYWGNMTANFNLRIEDADALESFNAEIAKIDEKAATIIN